MTALRAVQTTILLIRRISPQCRIVDDNLRSIATTIEVEDSLLGCTINSNNRIINLNLGKQILHLVAIDELILHACNLQILNNDAIRQISFFLIGRNRRSCTHLDDRNSQCTSINRSTVTIDSQTSGYLDRSTNSIASTSSQVNCDILSCTESCSFCYGSSNIGTCFKCQDDISRLWSGSADSKADGLELDGFLIDTNDTNHL